MRLALRELRRRPGRFVAATVILALIALLLMFLGGLLDGLIRSSTAAVNAQAADVVVFSSSARSSFARSRIEPAVRAQVEAVPGVRATGGIGVAQLGARVPGRDPRDLVPVALFGYELPPRGVPAPPGPGEAWADDVLRRSGIREGTELLLGPARSPVRVVGFVHDTSFSGQGTLWATPATWRDVQNANRPGDRVAEGVFQSLVVRGDQPAGELAAAIDAATGVTRSLTVAATADALPGVSQQRRVFNQVIGVTAGIAVVVVALFFALLTVERTALYGVLKAIGARSRTLFAGLVVQAVVVTSAAALAGAALAVVLDAVIPSGSIPFAVSAGRLVISAGLLVVAAVVGCAFSLRRVLRVDPASAIGGVV